MNENRSSLGKLLSLFLLLFFFVIVLFVLFAMLSVNDYKVFPAVLTFFIINFILLLVVIGGAREIVGKIGAASYVPVCVVTVIYTLLQFLYLGSNYQSEAINGYILYHLILLFVYFIVIIPIVLMGSKNNSR